VSVDGAAGVWQVMLLAPPGAGKTTVWKTLVACYNWQKPKPVAVYETVRWEGTP
jgi:adenylate kinase family enzyme